jgi:hypothetical protein
MSKIILMDWQRGKIPFFVPPPGFNENTGEKLEPEKEAQESNANENQKVSIKNIYIIL